MFDLTASNSIFSILISLSLPSGSSSICLKMSSRRKWKTCLPYLSKYLSEKSTIVWNMRVNVSLRRRGHSSRPSLLPRVPFKTGRKRERRRDHDRTNDGEGCESRRCVVWLCVYTSVYRNIGVFIRYRVRNIKTRTAMKLVHFSVSYWMEGCRFESHPC